MSDEEMSVPTFEFETVLLGDDIVPPGEDDVNEENFVQFLTPERDPLPDDAFAEEADQDNGVPEEELLADLEDFADIDPEDIEGLDEEDLVAEEDPADPDSGV